MGSLAFANPVILIALVALPAIWWLLRITPPRPVREVFPPLKILLGVGHQEETPATSPLWLTLLRMALAALIIVALSGPVLDPARTTLSADGPLALVIDNDWASAPDWDARVKTAAGLIDEAAARDIPVSLTLTAEPGQDPTPQSADTAMKRLNAARPRPLEADRNAAFRALGNAFQGARPGTLAYITSGVSALHDSNVDDTISALAPAAFRVFQDHEPPFAITNVRNGSGDIEVTAVRADAKGRVVLPVAAHDSKGRVLTRGTLEFADGQKVAGIRLAAPIELRNDFTRVTISDIGQAGATYLLDDGFKRRRVGVLSGESRFLSQPLLSPLYYIRRALSPYVDLVEPTDTDLAKSVPEILEQKPSMIVLADIGRLPDSTYPLILDWIRKGGTLVRFAGPRLAASPKDDPLVPVELREGERSLGGALSWSQPQPLAPFPDKGPFAGLPTPDGVLIKRQVLANPSPTLAEHTWASLADGTPLVTGKRLDAGEIVLFHTTADTSWSNLPLSGHFVEMLRRIAQISRSHGNAAQNGTETLAPFKLMDARGDLTADIGPAKPLVLRPGTPPRPGFDNPPGLYGSEEGYSALNLFSPGRELSSLKLAPKAVPVEAAGLAGSGATELRPMFLLAAFILLAADSLAVLFMGGAFAAVSRRRSAATATLLVCAGLAAALLPGNARADDSRPGDAAIIASLDATHLAYVITGETDVDRISREGLRGLSDFLMYRTSLEPGDPEGVDIERDELAFYPLIYWPVRASAPMPSKNAISRIDAYMRSGGTVLFDTQDEFSSLDPNTTSPNTQRLQAILADLDIPPLEPVPPTHVLTKSFYLLQNFPGRYNGSPLWVEASADPKGDQGRPVQRGDGVSPIMITANDFAGAWAVDEQGNPLLPTVPPDDRQRELAFRAGVNIVMYMLTGNYKSDQVHIPALLERLGQ